MTDWLELYDETRTTEGSVIRARKIIVSRMIDEENIPVERAQDKLTQLINDRVQHENQQAGRPKL